MGVLIGAFAGSLIDAFLVYSVLHWAICKRIDSDPLRSRVIAATVAYPASALIYGLGVADGKGLQFAGFGVYLPATAVILLLAVRAGRAKRREADERPDFAVRQLAG